MLRASNSVINSKPGAQERGRPSCLVNVGAPLAQRCADGITPACGYRPRRSAADRPDSSCAPPASTMLACDFFHVDCAVTLCRVYASAVIEVSTRYMHVLSVIA